jgi:hypothetical protein
MTPEQLDLSRALTAQLRMDSIAVPGTGSEHPTSWLPVADLMPVLLVGHLKYD